MSVTRKSQDELAKEMKEVKKHVEEGGIYCHYKNPDKKYKVLAIGFFESSEKLCVVYKSLYGSGIVWVRGIEVFTDKVDVGGKLVSRFHEVK